MRQRDGYTYEIRKYGAVTHVRPSGRTKLRIHNRDAVLVADDENAEIYSQDTRSLATRVKRNTVSNRNKRRNRTFSKEKSCCRKKSQCRITWYTVTGHITRASGAQCTDSRDVLITSWKNEGRAAMIVVSTITVD